MQCSRPGFYKGQGRTQVEIAEMPGVCERTVRYHLKSMPASRRKPRRGSKVDVFKAKIDEILEANSFYNGELIYERLVRMGYSGKISVMKDYVASARRKLAIQAVMRFETEPGLQAQVDWKEFGKQPVDGRVTKLYAFVMVLGYSRKAFVLFTTGMDTATLLACHVLAFAYFGGIPREILYDTMRTAFQPDVEGNWLPTKRLLTLAGLNDQVCLWLAMIDAKKLSGFDDSRAERFSRERPLLKIPTLLPFDARREVPVLVNRESLIRHDTNSYSVPPEHIGTMLTLKVQPFGNEVEVFGLRGSIRRFLLTPHGTKAKFFFPEDREAIRKRWDADRARLARVRKPRVPRIKAQEPEVQVRPPAVYDALFAENVLAVTA
ncbi:MAG: IS21 family transposase [Rectinemataceae bacterium]